MDFRSEFELHTDLLITYAIYMSGLFFFGILCCAVLICYKFIRQSREQLQQQHCITLFQALFDAPPRASPITEQLNAFIRERPITACYGIVRCLENKECNSIKHFHEKLNLVELSTAINASIKSVYIKNKAIALEAMGLTKIAIDPKLIWSHLNDNNLAPFATEALARIKGKAALPDIARCHQNQQITNSQLLTALLQINPSDLSQFLNSPEGKLIPAELLRYLRAS